MRNAVRLALAIVVFSSMGCGRKPEAVGHEAEIRALIEKLALSNEPAGMSPVYAPDQNAPADHPYLVALAAARELRALGREAFPHLVERLDDGRQSIPFRRVLPSTVGDACFCIIRDQIFALPDDYRGSLYRVGADGQRHERPFFCGPELFGPSTVAEWLAERRDRTLAEMQVEALEWLLKKEEAIGFPSEEDAEAYYWPLARALDEARAAAARK